MKPQEVKSRIEEGLPNALCKVNEFSGGMDHYSVMVICEAFEGQALLKRHRMIMDLFKGEIDTGEVHALSIKAFTKNEYAKEGHL